MRNGKDERKIYVEGRLLPERKRKKETEKVAIQQQKKNQSTRKKEHGKDIKTLLVEMQGEASAECYQPSARLRLFLVLHEVAAYWQRLGYLYPPPASLFSIWWWILNPPSLSSLLVVIKIHLVRLQRFSSFKA